MQIPTVTIKNPKAKSGITHINESDFDPKTMTLDKPKAKPAKKREVKRRA